MPFHLLFALLWLAPPEPADFTSTPLTRIAFGSCCDQEKPQPIWGAINAWHPQLFVFLGDNVYGDTHDMDELRAKYAQLGAKQGVQTLMSQSAVAATWDDHDYGANDAGLEYSMKEASKEVFLEFFEEPLESERRTRPGIYSSVVLGPEGKRVQLILLDVRTFRSSLAKREHTEVMKEGFLGPYGTRADAESTMLGSAQWTWLEEQLQVPAEVRLIAMSTQFLPVFTGWEAWANMPRERSRLLELIRTTRSNGVIFISGDTHWAELSRVEQPGMYPLWDLTSSGLTEVWKGISPNRHRVHQPYLGANFGAISIDWEAPGGGPLLILEIRDVDGVRVLRHQLRLDELDFELEPDVPINLSGAIPSSRGPLSLIAAGDRIQGSFGPPEDPGTLQGRRAGRRITGTWQTRSRSGPFEIEFSRTGQWMGGRWGIDDQAGPEAMPWAWTGRVKP